MKRSFVKEGYDALQGIERIISNNNLIHKCEELIDTLDSALQDYELALAQLELNHIEH